MEAERCGVSASATCRWGPACVEDRAALQKLLHEGAAALRFVIGMTVTDEERKGIKAAAEAEDLTASTWLRWLALGRFQGQQGEGGSEALGIGVACPVGFLRPA